MLRRKICLGMTFVLLMSVALSCAAPASADYGQGGTNHNLTPWHRIFVTYPHKGFSGFGDRTHINVFFWWHPYTTTFKQGAQEFANFHVVKDGNCLMVYESHRRWSKSYCIDPRRQADAMGEAMVDACRNTGIWIGGMAVLAYRSGRMLKYGY